MDTHGVVEVVDVARDGVLDLCVRISRDVDTQLGSMWTPGSQDVDTGAERREASASGCLFSRCLFRSFDV